MKKKTAYIAFGIGGALVVGFSPLFINWACRGNLNADPRAHYVAGLGRIAGWFGRDEVQADQFAWADRIERDVVIVKFKAETEEEMKALWSKAASTRWSWNPDTYETFFEVDREYAGWMREELASFQKEYKGAQQDSGGDP